jgi:hypothetical protein
VERGLAGAEAEVQTDGKWLLSSLEYYTHLEYSICSLTVVIYYFYSSPRDLSGILAVF